MPSAIAISHGLIPHTWRACNLTRITVGHNHVRHALCAQQLGMMQLPGHMYPQCMSVVGVIVKWFVFDWIGVQRKIVTSVSSEKVVVFSATDINGRF